MKRLLITMLTLGFLFTSFEKGQAADPATRQDAYFSVPLSSLTASDVAPKPDVPGKPRGWAQPWPAFATVEGDGEAYLSGSFSQQQWYLSNGNRGMLGTLAIRGESGKDVSGVLYLVRGDVAGMVALKFSVAADKAKPEARAEFFGAKAEHYQQLATSGMAGGAWFRYQANQAELALSRKSDDPANVNIRRRWQAEPRDLEGAYDLFSGGRAVSENLQFDRAMVMAPTTRPATQPSDDRVGIKTLTGITVREMDWTALLAGTKPRLDPLASLIPVDQHALFFPTFAAAIAVTDESNAQATPVLHAVSPHAEDARTVQRYEQQLCLSMSGLARLLGPRVIRSVALTGSDPYYMTGTDLAVLFETDNPANLRTLLTTQVALAASTKVEAKAIKGSAGGVEYNGMVSSDRAVSSYVAIIGNAVIVTNSLAQLERLAAVKNGSSPPLTSAPEYKFFRSRYPLGNDAESALLVLPDAAIRRWCGPRWRIASARRTIALAVMSDVEAQQLDDLEHHRPAAPLTNPSTFELGTLTSTAQGITSSIYGSMTFMTPIAEMAMEKVEPREAIAYERWRDTYQQNWQQYFDPIALRISIRTDRLAADLTVAPLIVATQYRELIEVTKGASIAPKAGDPHPDLLHLIMAVNKQSHPARQASGFASNMAPALNVDPLGWMGQSVAVFVDDDPLWQEMAKVSPQQFDQFIEKHLSRLPLAISAEVADGFKLTAFLASLRVFIEQSSPGMTNWEVLKYQEHPYVKVSQANPNQGPAGNMAIYYAASPDALILSPNEDVIKHALDRQAARRATAAAATQPDNAANAPPPLPPEEPWLGSHFNARVDRKAINIIEAMARDNYQSMMQQAAWNNIPILNEWKRRFPDEDPVKFHEKQWHTRLVCPGGGTYVWNEAYHTMESTVYGHPGQPNDGAPMPATLSSIQRGDTGLTFEDQGLRARVVIDRDQPKP